MNNRSLLALLIDTSMALCLLVVLGALVYGHVGGAESGLSLTESYITEYMKKAPHWPWLIVASFTFALLLFLLALSLLIRSGGNILVLLGCLLLTATAMGNFFVAYAPMRRVEQPPPSAHEWWTPAWWFTSTTSRTDYEHGMADAYSDVHYRAIRLVVSFGVAAMFALGAAHLREARSRFFGRVTLIAAIVMSALFLMGDHWDFHRGLWQRLGFAVMYVWLWGAWTICRSSHKFSISNDNPG